MSDQGPRPRVDPRFDPVFQRGYDPAVHAPPPPPRAPERPDSIGAPPPGIREPVSAPVPASASVPDEDDPDLPNPWRLVLLIVSLGLLAVAAVFLWVIGQRDVNGSSGIPSVFEILLQQLSYQLPTALVIPGIAGILTWVALGAVRRGR